ncbi:uncharacterized protein ASCRUDRAFT_33456 [Ascoidea rubescens DSM 1968]|uniref:Amino acid permease/ SLC12A domain-containing protein n=1 Tax=Ascoidea rubescens DSM 1968 TaxID=1344418 RepID=A0A1D2VKB6_9ASCO|nr:hypothetical protein ASCRUDRAFT_33456 [Ascoidea rubescens DSM 1968]ODV62050.1 hypothetical protein ASCRUDRAFT_33456 [Ascoidea rubescens DSM 1968]
MLKQTVQFNGFEERYDPDRYGNIKRGLNLRHVSLMTIGSCIGSSLFVGLAIPLIRYGSLSLFLAFITWAFLDMWPLMQCATEMAVWLPIKGSFFHFAGRFVDPALGFACGIIYAYSTAMYVCVELVAMGSLVRYWESANIPTWSFIFLGLVLYIICNIFAVNWFGEIEFVGCMFKILLIIGLMMFSFLSMCGANPKGDAYGFSNWSKGGLFKPYLEEGDLGKFIGFWNVFVYSAFSSGGPEFILIIAGEIERPRRSIPVAGRNAFFRIYLFYIGGIFFMNCICASNDPNLLEAVGASKIGAGASPWVIGIENAGVRGFSSLINAIIITSVWSCGNAAFYSSTRCLYSLSLVGYIPRIFSMCLKNGSPIFCVAITALISCLSFLSCSTSSQKIYIWFITITTSCVLMVHSTVFLSYICFRKSMKVQGYRNHYYQTPFKLQPYCAYTGLILCIVTLLFNGAYIFWPGNFSVQNLFVCYFSPVAFIILYLFWKILKKTKIHTSREADIITGKLQIDREEEIEEAYFSALEKKDGVLRKFFRFIEKLIYK